MNHMVEKGLWFAVAGLATIVAAQAINYGLTKSWKAIARHDPPINPESPRTGWGEATLWAVTTGAAAGIGRLLARRGAAAGWRVATGHKPPGLEKVV